MASLMTFQTACPTEDCEHEITIEILSFTRGWPGNYETPPEYDEIEWVLAESCAGCGLDNDSAFEKYREPLEIIAFEKYDGEPEPDPDDDDALERHWEERF